MSAGEVMPCTGITSAAWALVPQRTEVEALSGGAVSIDLGPAFWEIDLDVSLFSRDVFDLWAAFIARRRGSSVPFTAWRTFRSRPRDSGVSSDASLTLPSVSIANSTITLGNAGTYTAYPGDMLSYRTQNSGYWVGVSTAQVSAAGGSITIPVEPAPRARASSGQSPRRIQALGEFRLDGEPRFRESQRRRSLRFKARQVIR